MSTANEVFAALFQESFKELMTQGIPKNEAAAKALLTTQQKISAAAKAKEQPSVSTSAVCETNSNAKKVDPRPDPKEMSPPLDIEDIEKIVKEAKEKSVFSTVVKTSYNLFSSSRLLNESFGKKRSPKKDPAVSVSVSADDPFATAVSTAITEASAPPLSPAQNSKIYEMALPAASPSFPEVYVNIPEVTAAYKALLSCEGAANGIMFGLESLTFNLQTAAVGMHDASSLPQFIIVLEHPQMLDPSMHNVLGSLLKAINALPEPSQQMLSEWIGQHAGVVRFKRYIDVLQQYITLQLLDTKIDSAKAAVRVMNLLYVQYEVRYADGGNANGVGALGLDAATAQNNSSSNSNSSNSNSAACALEAATPRAPPAPVAAAPLATVTYGDFYNDTLNDEFFKTRTGKKQELSLWQLDTQKGNLLLRQRELDKERKRLAVLHEEQTRHLNQQKSHHQVLAEQKEQLRGLQEQLQTLESSVGNSREAANPAEVEGLLTLQQRLSSLDNTLREQRQTLNELAERADGGATSSSSSSADASSPVATVTASVDIDSTAPAAEEATVSSAANTPTPPPAPVESTIAVAKETPSAPAPPTEAAAPSTVAEAPPAVASASTSSSTPAPLAERATLTPILPAEQLMAEPTYMTLWEKLPFVKRESFLSYSFMLTPATKAEILELVVAMEVESGFHLEVDEARRRGQTHIVPYFILQVRRDHIVMDTLNRILAANMLATESAHMSSSSSSAGGPTDIASKIDANLARMCRKPLKIIFDGEEGIDAGGVRKEYYQLLMKQLLDPSFGMFNYYEDSRLLWINPHGFENEQEFELIGLMIGIALYNSIILDLRMPMVVYKKLRGRKGNFADFKELQPTVAKSLTQLLEYDGDAPFEDVFYDMHFDVTQDVFGAPVTVELKPGGSDVLVTMENRREYVDCYVQYYLEDSIKTQFNAFAKGFRKVCDNKGMELFNWAELELLICGNPLLDFADLRRGTKYEDGYTADSEIIHQFWVVVGGYTEEEKRKFLKFISGSDRSPIEGLSEMKFVIGRSGVASDPTTDTRLPSAHTCFNHLLLPPYSSIAVLRAKLGYAIENAEGFGLR